MTPDQVRAGRARARRIANTRKRALDGAPLKVPSASARLALEHLYGLNWSSQEIAAGLFANPETVRLIRRRQEIILRTTHDDLCALARAATPRPLRYKGFISADLARNAVRGLSAQGHTIESIASAIGANHRSVWRLQAGVSEWISRGYSDAIIAHARRIGSARGQTSQANRVANLAAAKGWLSTMYIDELV